MSVPASMVDTKAKRVRGPNAPWGMFGVGKRVRLYQRFGQFAQARYPTTQMLDSILKRMERTKDKRRGVYAYLKQQVQEGRTFSDVLGEYIPSSERLVIAAGEANGNLHTGFKLATYTAEAQKQIRSTLIGALIYPCFLLVALSGLLIMIAYKIMPAMEEMLDPALWPPVSTGLYNIAKFVKNDLWWVAGLAVVSGFYAIKTLPTWNSSFRRQVLDRFVPPWSVYQRLECSNFLIAMSALTHAGRPIDDSLKYIRAVCSPWLSWHVTRMQAALGSGVPVGEMIDTGLLDAETAGDIEDFANAGGFAEAIRMVGENVVADTLIALKIVAAIAMGLIMVLIGVMLLWTWIAMGFVVLTLSEAMQSGAGI